MDDEHERFPDGITAIDTHTAGLSHVTAGYLVNAPRPALIECGPALSIATVIQSLQGLGMEPGDLAYLVLSHIHLDHAGGAGDIAQAFPHAQIVVSEIGAPHLADPERLNASSRRVYGPLMDTVYGECTPIAPDRIVGVADGDTLDLGGGRVLDLLYTPGHAKHHIGVFDRDSGGLFVGDSVGVRMPGMRQIRPATPPPDFDLELSTRTLQRYRELEPERMYLAHYGLVTPPDQALDEAEDRLRLWFAVAEGAWQEHRELDHIAETLAHRFADEAIDEDADPDLAARVELLNGFRSNAAGLLRYLDLREQGRLPR